MFPKGPS